MEKSNPKQIKKIYQSELKSVGNKVMSVLRKLNKNPKQRRKKKNKGIAKQVFIIFFSHVHRSMNSHFKQVIRDKFFVLLFNLNFQAKAQGKGKKVGNGNGSNQQISRLGKRITQLEKRNGVNILPTKAY